MTSQSWRMQKHTGSRLTCSLFEF